MNTRLRPQLICDSLLPDQLLDIYDHLKNDSFFKHSWESLDGYSIWKELCFCLLSGNVNYDLVSSTIDVLDNKGYLNFQWIVNDSNSQHCIFDLLNNSNFEPKKKNGKLRKYRYPKKRSYQIIKAAEFIHSESSLKDFLKKFPSEIDARDFFIKNIPGLGIKESSHFLRNIGYSHSMAIIDIHVTRFIAQNGFIIWDASSLTITRYRQLEIILQNLADFHGLDLNIFDLAIWNYMRGQK